MLRTVLVFSWMGFTLVASTPFLIIGVVLRLLGLRRLIAGTLKAFAGAWARSMVLTTGSTVTVSGLENIPRTGGVCFVGNHQGSFDILIGLGWIPRPFGFVAKKETIFFPFIGPWIYLLDGLFLDRKNPRKALGAIQLGSKRIAKGSCMLIFPEGTRDRGKALLPFRPGALKLASQVGAPIIPMAFEGSHNVWETLGRVAPAEVRVVFGKPIPTAGLSSDERKLLAPRVQDEVARLRSTLIENTKN